ncbi:hypothetical protein FHS94_001635 [Sphingomonas aerophila]|uniref:Uncharacterized protein n=1 Tax=Sphingomonas aerophila TaxID=1344948 RepID=A0A7W9EU17_9SPHN|nr:hypothetical protein [Sphingomonas aerophila]
MIHAPPVQAIAQAASLQQLFSAHQQLLDGLARLETETARPVPDKAAVGAARLALSQASRKRSTILDSVLASEARIRTGPDLLQLVALQDSVRRARTASTAHVARWSQSTLEADWRGYCRDSALMRRHMRRQMEAETQFFVQSSGSGGGRG